ALRSVAPVPRTAEVAFRAVPVRSDPAEFDACFGSATGASNGFSMSVAEPVVAAMSLTGSDRTGTARKATSAVRGTGATDLSAGNMVRPGKAFADAKRAGDQVRTAVSDAADQLTSTVKSSVGSITAAKKAPESAGAPTASRGDSDS
ncbi:hypothetical protein, partial [Mycolicibacterium setense]|uniref:hypothetical protein n=1 Tax=Mycolicibacterium setense TaxID=431269 RepID=UPI000A99A3D2